ncbi:MAG: hypothetical protein WA949_04045 [Phormidesmis sp.]
MTTATLTFACRNSFSNAMVSPRNNLQQTLRSRYAASIDRS